MYKWIIIFIPFFLFSATTKISLLIFNNSYELLPSKEGKGGLASMMSLLEKERKKSPHHLTALNGDFISPLYMGKWDQGAHLIDLLNQMRVDLVLLGNHEFDYGLVELKERINESSFSWVASNLIEISGKPFLGNQCCKIYDFDGVKVGIFGLAHINRQILIDQRDDLLFLPVSEVARQVLGDLRKEGVEVLIVLTHLSIGEDRLLARQFPEIDLIIGGHEGGPIFWYERGTFIYRSSYDDQYLTRINLVIEKSVSSKGKMTQVIPCFQTILNKESHPNKEVSDKIDFYYKMFNVNR